MVIKEHRQMSDVYTSPVVVDAVQASMLQDLLAKATVPVKLARSAADLLDKVNSAAADIKAHNAPAA
jgi:hypothetical protein